MIVPNTIARRLEVLCAVFCQFAEDGDASFQMNAERGGCFIQLSNRDWPDGVPERVEMSGQASYVEIIPGKYSWVIKIKGDEIKS